MRIFIVVLCLVFAGTANAFYKCKKPDGSVSFSDAPCGVRDDGVDIEKEQRYQESLEKRTEQERDRLAMEKRERTGKLMSERKRQDVFVRQYFKVIAKDAIPHYTAEEYPELEKTYYDRMVDIESYRLSAVRLVLNSQQCDKVSASNLDQPNSTPKDLNILVECVNGNRFRLHEKEITKGTVPAPLDAAKTSGQQAK